MINLIAVGHKMPDWIQTGFTEYTKRLPPDLKIRLIEIPSPKRMSQSNLAQIIKREEEQILGAIPQNGYTIALDVLGEQWDTHQLALKLKHWQEQRHPIFMVIGGPEGLTKNCLTRADIKWSLSPLTFPHPLVRVIVAEQLYRAWSILSHHPYHRN